MKVNKTSFSNLINSLFCNAVQDSSGSAGTPASSPLDGRRRQSLTIILDDSALSTGERPSTLDVSADNNNGNKGLGHCQKTDVCAITIMEEGMESEVNCD